MPVPTDKASWWEEYERIQNDIKSFTGDMPVPDVLRHGDYAVRILGQTSVDAYKEHQDKTIFEVWDILRDARDRRLWNILNGIWNDAPDSPSIHGWPSWGAFCDLCSEGGHILYPELAN